MLKLQRRPKGDVISTKKRIVKCTEEGSFCAVSRRKSLENNGACKAFEERMGSSCSLLRKGDADRWSS